MRRLVESLAILAALAVAAVAAGAENAAPRPSGAPGGIAFGRYHALVIGIDDYAKLPRLYTAVTDAEAVAETLRRDYGFDVTLLRNATRYEIIGTLNRLRTSLTEADNLLVYYAGHGVLDREAGRGYWLPADADEDVKANWISNTDITDEIKAMTAKHVMVVADSCYSGSLLRAAPRGIKSASARAAWLRRMVEKRSRTVLTSGGLEPVTDGGGGGHSVFAKAFLDALSENAEVLDGQTLFAAIRRPIVVNSRQTPEYSDVRMAGHDGGDFLFVRTGFPATAMAVPGPETRRPESQADPTGTGLAAQTAFWTSIEDSADPRDYRAYLTQFPNGVFAALARNRLASLARTVRPAKTPGESSPGAAARQSDTQQVAALTVPTMAGRGYKALRVGMRFVHKCTNERGKTSRQEYTVRSIEKDRIRLDERIGGSEGYGVYPTWGYGLNLYYDRLRKGRRDGFALETGSLEGIADLEVGSKHQALFRRTDGVKWQYTVKIKARKTREVLGFGEQDVFVITEHRQTLGGSYSSKSKALYAPGLGVSVYRRFEDSKGRDVTCRTVEIVR